jgi:exonuclease SbcC
MLLLKKIKLNNFISHEDTEINFNPNQRLLLDGDSGSGKTSILEGITFALYGTGRSSNTSLVRRGQKKAIVTLELFDEESTYLIERSVLASGKHSLSVSINGVAHELTGVRDLQNWIEKELVGASYLLFVNSVAYLQGGTDTFVTQSAPRRKELLLEIVNVENFDALYEKARSFMTDKTGDKSLLDKEVEMLKIQTDEHEKNITQKPVYEEALKNLKSEIDILNKEMKKLVQEQTTLKAMGDQIIGAKKQASSLDSDISELKTEIEDLNASGKELQKLQGVQASKVLVETQIEELNNSLKEDVKSLAQGILERETLVQEMAKKPTASDRSSLVANLRKDIDDLRNKPDCSAGEKCPYMSDKLSKIKELEGRINELKTKSDEEAASILKWSEVVSKIKAPSPEKIKEMKDNLDTENGQLADLLAEREDLDKKIWLAKFIEDKIKSLPTLMNKLNNKEAALKEAKDHLATLEKSLDIEAIANIDKKLSETLKFVEEKQKEASEAMAELSMIKKVEEKLPMAKKTVVELTKQSKKINGELEKVAVLKEAFGSKGIKTVVIDWLLPNLEEKINENLSYMSDFRIHLDTQQEKSDGEGNKEGLFITIINEMGEEMPFENYSGGERLKLVVAISEALASLQKVGFRIFDEIFLGLDEDSTESFAIVLERLNEKFAQVLCISHLRQIKDSFEDQVKIIKHNGVSTIQ